jgi:phage tail-like protein
MPLFNELVYNEGLDNTEFFLSRLVESLPAPYRPAEYRDFIERLLRPSAEDLARVNETLDRLDTYVYPESAPEPWLDWMLAEWWGWSLIPDGYPVERKRRLLSNLHLHYKRRYSTLGIKELLAEFGAIAEVYDRPLYSGSYLGSYGITSPLNVWVRVLYYEPWESPQDNYIGNYIGHTYAYRTTPIVTNKFVADLCEWSRAAGVRMIVEYVTRNEGLSIKASIYGQPTEIGIDEPITNEPNITE